MNESQIVEIWQLFKEYLDKKHVDIAAERFIDLLADYGVGDDTMTAAIGTDVVLDHAINYYLDLEDTDDYVFLGWNSNPEGTGTWYYNGDQFLRTQRLTLYAIWQPK